MVMPDNTMLEFINKFPNDIKDALEIYNTHKFKIANRNYKNIVICGMGGSGIAGSIIQKMLISKSSIPVIINKNYNIPKFVNGNSLVILVSYSGNTVETLNSFNQLIELGIHNIICISSGGELESINNGNVHQYDFIKVPVNQPPRTTLAYSLTFLLSIINSLGYLELQEDELFKISDYLIASNKDIINTSKNIANEVFRSGKIPILYSSEELEGVTLRWKQQINENSKEYCWYNVIPEMNHNELVSWTKETNLIVLMLIASEIDLLENKNRIDLNIEMLNVYSDVLKINAVGSTYLEQLFFLIHLGDYVSYYIAEFKDVDPIEIKIIDKLKSNL